MVFFCLCVVPGGRCAVRRAPGAARRRTHRAGLGMVVRPLAFLGGVSFSRKFLKEFFTKAGSRALFQHLILFGACALHVHAETSMCFPEKLKIFASRLNSTNVNKTYGIQPLWGYLRLASNHFEVIWAEAQSYKVSQKLKQTTTSCFFALCIPKHLRIPSNTKYDKKTKAIQSIWGFETWHYIILKGWSLVCVLQNFSPALAPKSLPLDKMSLYLVMHWQSTNWKLTCNSPLTGQYADYSS